MERNEKRIELLEMKKQQNKLERSGEGSPKSVPAADLGEIPGASEKKNAMKKKKEKSLIRVFLKSKDQRQSGLEKDGKRRERRRMGNVHQILACKAFAQSSVRVQERREVLEVRFRKRGI